MVHLPMGRFAAGARDRQRRAVPRQRRVLVRDRLDVPGRRRALGRLRHAAVSAHGASHSSTGRPAIGICAAIERARFGPWDQEATLLARGYSDAVQAAGGLALLLPPDDVAAEHPADAARPDRRAPARRRARPRPAHLRRPPEPETVDPSPERDRFEVGLATAALERDMPVARRVPRDADAERGLRRHPAAAPGRLPGRAPPPHPGVFSDHDVRSSRDRWPHAPSAASTQR